MNFAAILTVNFAAGCAFSALVLLAGHWFPWDEWTGHELSRIASYTYGVSAIWIGFVIWTGDAVLALGLLLICDVSGLAVVVAHALDRLALKMAQARRREMADDAGE